MIVLKNELKFNELEKEIYEYGCKVAREVMVKVLTTLDDNLAQERNKGKYRDKGKRNTSIKTLMGEVEFSRRVYQCESETGKKGYIYLLDQLLELKKVGMFSGNLIQLITEAATKEWF